MSTGKGEGEKRREFYLVHLDNNHLFHTMISTEDYFVKKEGYFKGSKTYMGSGGTHV